MPNDPRDKQHNVPSKPFTVKLQAGKTYQIDMASKEVDSFLRLLDASGIQLAENDDFQPGLSLDARIVFACPRDGDYRIIATTMPGPGPMPATGNFTLTVQQQQVGQPPAAGPVVFRKDDQLTNADPKDKNRNVPSKVYTVKLQAGKTYQIDMASKEVDSFLRLEDASGVQLAENDDFQPPNISLDSRIVFICARDGEYRITATTATNVKPRTGNFTLTVQQK
jgi:hypothetical protein